METTYVGIDYGLGKSNVGPAGIRYGAIHQNSLNGDSLAEIFDNGEDLTFKQFQLDLKNKLRGVLDDYLSDMKWGEKTSKLDRAVDDAFDAIKDDVNEAYQPDNPAILYKRDGYTIQNALDTDLMILESPYYTFAQFCSPCLPGAGNLDCPVEGGAKTYCLGHDWFDNKAPYPVYSVADGKLVEPTN